MTTDLPGHVPPVLFDVDALLRGRFPRHEVRCVRVATQWRFILTNPGQSKMFAVTDTAIAEYKHAQEMATAVLESRAFARLESATASEIVVFLADGSYRVDFS